MAKQLGSPAKPLVVRVQTQEQAYEVAARCNKHGFQFVMGIEPDKPVDISDLERALGHAPPAAKLKPATSTKVGRNEPCPCGSGKKFKHCCVA